MNKNNNKNALVIRPGSLGDTVATIPVLLSLKKNSFNVYLIGNEKVNGYLQQKKIINAGIGFSDARLVSFFSEKKNIIIPNFPLEFDLIFCYIEKDEIFSQNLISSFGNRVMFHSVPEIPECNITEFLLKPLKKIGLKTFYPEIRSKNGSKFFIHPGSGSKKKNWPAENFLKVFNTIQKYCECKIILGECEMSDFNFWAEQAGKQNLIVPDDLMQLARILETGSYFIGNDSGVSHLSAFLGLHTFIIFGPTDPEIWAPVGENVVAIKSDVNCSPCTSEKRNKCKTVMCLQKIPAERIIFTLKKYLKLIKRDN